MKYILIDISKIQEYVFASNRLREICNASLLLDWIETEKIPQIAKSYSAEVIRSGGGICLIKTNNNNASRLQNEIVRLFKGYGIGVTTAKKDLDSYSNFYNDVLAPLFKEINFTKNQPEKETVLPSTILAVPCEATGSSPAECIVSLPGEPEGKRYNLPSASKHSFKKDISDVETCLMDVFPEVGIPRDLGGIVNWKEKGDAIGKEAGTSEKRLLGVIYADVNGLGSLTPNIARDEKTYKGFSEGLREAIKCSVLDTLHEVITKAIGLRKGFPSDEKALPLRVLYIGGDDLALAVQGCFALEVASEILKNFEGYSRRLLEDTRLKDTIPCLTMSAGVVIAPHKYPFSAFNRLGKELEQRAKSAGRLKRTNGISPPYIDFCLVKNNAMGGLDEVTGKVDNRYLTGGPYTPDEITLFEETAEKLMEKEFPMSKLKRLPGLLRSPARERMYRIWISRLKDEQQKFFEDEIIKKWNLKKESVTDIPLWRRNPLGLSSTPVVDIIDLIPLARVKRRGGE